MKKRRKKIINPMPPEGRSRWITSDELASFLGGLGGKLDRRTLKRYRDLGMPVAGMIGRTFRYNLEDVIQWFTVRKEEYERKQKEAQHAKNSR